MKLDKTRNATDFQSPTSLNGNITRLRRARWHARVFCGTIVLFSVLNLVWFDRSDVSEQENRALAPVPQLNGRALASGQFARSFDAWLNDHLGFRNQLIAAYRRLAAWATPNFGPRIVQLRSGDLFEDAGNNTDESRGAASSSNLTDTAADIGRERAQTEQQQSVKDSVSPPVNTESHSSQGILDGDAGGVGAAQPLVDEQASSSTEGQSESVQDDAHVTNSILILDGQGFEILGFDEGASQYYADAVSRFARMAGSQVVTYAMLAPGHLAQIDPDSYGGPLGANQQEGIGYIYEQMDDTVRTIDIFPMLSDPDADTIYFGTDHHWTARGAYLAYRQFARSAHFIPVPLSNYERRQVEGFVGSLYLLSGSAELKAHPDTLEVFLPSVEHEYQVLSYGEMVDKPVIDDFYEDRQNKYEMFISSDRPLGVIRSDVNSPRKIAVIKDSYGNAFVPFLMPHYREIHIIDPRYFDRNLLTYVREHEISEVLFINYFAVVGNARGYARNLNRVIDLEEDDEQQ